MPDTETLSVSAPSFRQIEGYAPTLLIWFLQLCNFATFSFDGEYLENGEPFSNFCTYMISASNSICILSFRQIDGVRPPTLVKFSKYHETLALTRAVPARWGRCRPRSGFFFADRGNTAARSEAGFHLACLPSFLQLV